MKYLDNSLVDVMSFGPTNSTSYGQETGQYRHGRTLATRDEPHPSSPRITAAAIGPTMSDDRVPPTPPLPFLFHDQHPSAYSAHASMPQVRRERVYTSPVGPLMLLIVFNSAPVKPLERGRNLPNRSRFPCRQKIPMELMCLTMLGQTLYYPPVPILERERAGLKARWASQPTIPSLPLT